MRILGKRWRRMHLCLISLACGFIIWLLWVEMTSSSRTRTASLKISVPEDDLSPVAAKANKRNTLSVLLHTSLFYRQDWYGKSPQHLLDYTSTANCPVKECTFSYDKTDISHYDALVFHFLDIPNPSKRRDVFMKELSAKRTTNQRWIFFVHEPPPATIEFYSFNVLNGYFNWTMSFSRRSEVMLTYFTTEPSLPSEVAVVNHAKGKTKRVVFASSHCGVFREGYVLELQKYIDVTVFGSCASRYKLRGEACPRDSAVCIKKMKQFKFYLAFESQFCHDYVTEKYWKNALSDGLVPVVMGANYDGLNSVPGSYIDVANFQSIKDLADYLLYLDRNDTAYNEYFTWKRGKNVVHNDMFCKLCEELHNEKHDSHHVYDNLQHFWSKQELCGRQYDGKKLELTRQIEHSKKTNV